MRRLQYYGSPPEDSAIRAPRGTWIGMWIGAVITVPALFVAALSAGAGHGAYVAARLLFPVPMLATLLTQNTFGIISIGLAVMQFPAYGFFLGGSPKRGSLIGALASIVLHILAATACFTGAIPNFG